MSDCTDLDSNCGYWATQGKCKSDTSTMIDSCPRSCGFCPISVSDNAHRLLDSRKGA